MAMTVRVRLDPKVLRQHYENYDSYASGIQLEFTLTNITEIHYKYGDAVAYANGEKEQSIAFESDINRGGNTYRLSEVSEFEATLEPDFTKPVLLYPDEWVYVPGEYVCTVCNCHISKRVILASSGRVGVSPLPENEMCPNGCKMMSRVTWRDRAASLSKYIDTLHELTDKPHLILPPSTNQA